MQRVGSVIGLTGGIGCGKSTVAELFATHGIVVIDTDLLAHELTAKGGAAIPAIRHEFGDVIISGDGSLDRHLLRKKVFAEASARAVLESILHPMIRHAVAAKLSTEAACLSPYVLLVVPLLHETMGYRSMILRTLAVDCTVKSQLERVKQRPGLDDLEARRIVASQIERPYRLQLADDVVFNDGPRASLAPRVSEIHHFYLTMLANTVQGVGAQRSL
jgi:dephospho-CoA kinase